MKKNINSAKHVGTEGSSLLLLILTSVRSDTSEFHLGGVSSKEQIMDFHIRKPSLFKVLILQNTASDNPDSRLMPAKSAVGAMKSWEREGSRMNPPWCYNPMVRGVPGSGGTLREPQWCWPCNADLPAVVGWLGQLQLTSWGNVQLSVSF